MSGDLAKGKIILPDGSTKEVLATPVEVAEADEKWSKFQLEDGSVVRVRPIIAKVTRTDAFDNDGNPIYQIVVGNVVFVDAAESLKKK